MKVMFVINSLNVGGAERMLVKLAQNTVFAEDEIIVVTLIAGGVLSHELLEKNHHIISLGLSRNPISWFRVFKLVGIMRKHKPDVVHSWLYQSDLVAGLTGHLVGKCPVIWSLRQSNLTKEHNKFTTRLCIKLCALLSRFLPDAIVSNAHHAKCAHLQVGYVTNIIEVIPNGFDLSQCKRDMSGAAEVRAELGIGQNASLVGMVGRFDSQKNHGGFFKAMRIILNAQSSAHFCLVGTGVSSDNPIINEMIYKNDIDKSRLHLLGHRNDINAIMNAIDVLALPSDGEAFPNVVGEAMACETPCVVTDVGDCSEIVGETGRTVPAGDMSKFADAVLDLLSMSKSQGQSIGRSARARVSELYNIDQVAKKYRELYVKHCYPVKELR